MTREALPFFPTRTRKYLTQIAHARNSKVFPLTSDIPGTRKRAGACPGHMSWILFLNEKRNGAHTTYIQACFSQIIFNIRTSPKAWEEFAKSLDWTRASYYLQVGNAYCLRWETLSLGRAMAFARFSSCVPVFFLRALSSDAQRLFSRESLAFRNKRTPIAYGQWHGSSPSGW